MRLNPWLPFCAMFCLKLISSSSIESLITVVAFAKCSLTAEKTCHPQWNGQFVKNLPFLIYLFEDAFFVCLIIFAFCVLARLRHFFLGADCQSRLWAKMPSSDWASLSCGICQKILFTYSKATCCHKSSISNFLPQSSKQGFFHISMSQFGIFLMKVNPISSINTHCYSYVAVFKVFDGKYNMSVQSCLACITVSCTALCL